MSKKGLDFCSNPNPTIPNHVAIIMDGNGRWAQKRHLPRLVGHERGAAAVQQTITAALEAGVKYLTLYAFSTENWNRPKIEVSSLMELLTHTLRSHEEKFKQEKIRLRAIGRLSDLPSNAHQELKRVMQETISNTRLQLILALSYSSRVEITDAVGQIAKKVREGILDPDAIDEETIAQHLYTSDIPDPDLLIRTSGEQRLSNFLLWQLSYTEIYTTPTLWPDFKKEDFLRAIEDFKQRERRFGNI